MDILEKLEERLNKGIDTEADASYLLLEVRKFLEQHNMKGRFEYLNFHCNWIAHSNLTGQMAQRVLKQFDEANAHLKAGIEMGQLPQGLQCEIERLSKFRYFQKEFSKFLADNNLPPITAKRYDGWAHFLHLYTKIIEDCPLVMKANNTTATIDNVTVKFELAKEPSHGEMLYKVRWIVLDKNGQTGEFYVINSFSLDTQE